MAHPTDAFAQFAEHTNDVVVRVNGEGRIAYISWAVRNFGYEPAELVGTTGAELIHPDDAASMTANVAALLRGERDPSTRREHRFRCKTGGWVWVEGNPYLEYDADGAVTGFVNVLRDVTERRAQADLFETAFEQSAIGKVLTGLDGRLFRVNDALCRMLGYEAEQILGLTTHSLAHPDQIGLSAENTQRLLAGEIQSYEAERRFRKADGTYLWVQLTVALVRHPDGSPKHYVSEVQDLTARKAAEAAQQATEARYRLIAENMSDLIFVAGLDGRSTYVSPSVARYGISPEEIQGREARDSVHPDDWAEMAAVFRELTEGGPSRRARWRGRDHVSGGWNWFESSPTLLRDPETGEPTGFLDVVRDISHQVEQEAALAAARTEAEEAAAAKSQFLANMSHEIRTPLTAVLGFTTLLEEMPLEPAAAGYVRRIAGAGNGLLAIVNDILDFSKIEAGKFEIRPRPTDLVGACEETLQLFTGQADEKGLALSFVTEAGTPPVAMLDGDRLRQMLVNLIGNAVKFTSEGRVTLRVAPLDGERVAVEVIDTGPGLDEEAQGRLFQRFTQIDGSLTRSHGGTGLGLAISRGLAEAMGGEIGVESTLGQGATFRIVLPAPAALTVEAEDETVDVASIEGARVFVVDDNPVNRELARRILTAAGADVEEASDGEEAVAALALLPVDIVLMDLRMPGLDGRRALERLRARPGPNQYMPVLAFTADAEMEGEGELAGFDGVVRKPIQPLEMYAAIASAMRWFADEEETTHATG